MDSHFIFINNKLEEITNNPILRLDSSYINEITEKIEIIDSSINNMKNDLSNLKKLSKINKVDINTQLLNANYKKLTLQKEEYGTLIFNKNIYLKDITKDEEINLSSLKELTSRINEINQEIEKNIKIKNTMVVIPKIVNEKKRASFLEIRNNKNLEKKKKKKNKNLEKLKKYKTELDVEKNQLKIKYEANNEKYVSEVNILSMNDFTNLEDKIINSKKIKDIKDKLEENTINFVQKNENLNTLISKTSNEINELSKIHISFKVEDKMVFSEENIEQPPEIDYEKIINDLKYERENLIKKKNKLYKKDKNLDKSEIFKLRKEIILYNKKLESIENNITNIKNVLEMNTTREDPQYLKDLETQIKNYKQKINDVKYNFEKLINELT